MRRGTMVKRESDSSFTIDPAKRGRGDKARTVRSRPAVRVEFPGEDEAIARKPYTFHIAASPGTVGVEVSIDRGVWVSCREALGLWWCDWTGFEKGDHELIARARMVDGITADSAPRRFSAD
jgi:hypothetical protein